MENVYEELDASLEPLLLKQVLAPVKAMLLLRVGKKTEILKKPDKTRVFSNKPVFSLGFFKAGLFQINQYTTI